jgi:hypothetical protein
VELPHVEKFYQERKAQGFGLVTLTADSVADVLKVVEYNAITHPMVPDAGGPGTDTVYSNYHAYDGKHYLIASDGTIVATFSKVGISLPILERELAKRGISTDRP